MPHRRANGLNPKRTNATTTHRRFCLRQRPLHIEGLEPRRLLATIVWDGEADDNWNNPVNWFNETTGTNPNNVLPGSGDDARIDAAFVNDTITHAAGTTTIRSLSSEATVAITGGSFTITDNSTINNALNVSGTGSLTLSSLTLGGTGTLTNEATVNLPNTTINAALDNRGMLLVTPGSSTINGALLTTVASTIRVDRNAGGAATLTVATATGFTNNGLIELIESSGAGGASGAVFNVTNGTLTNAASGEIQSLAGTGSARILNAQIDNQGTLTVNQSLTVTNTSRTFTSTSGTIEVDTGEVLTINGGTTVLGSGTDLMGAGQINLAGTHSLNLASDLTLTATKPAFAFGGTVTVAEETPGSGATLVNQSTLQLTGDTVNTALDNQGTLLVTPGGSTINGALSTSAASTIRVDRNAGGTATLTVANGFTNNGAIELIESSGAGGASGAVFNVTNGTLTNSASGEIQSLAGTGSARILNAQINHQGTLTVNQSLTVTNTSRTFTSTSGTIEVDTGEVLTINGGTTVFGSGTVFIGAGQINLAGTHSLNLASDFTLAAMSLTLNFGGAITINGPGTLINEAILPLSGDTVNASLDNRGTLLVTPGDSAITGTLLTNATSTIRVDRNATGTADLTVANGFTNNGAIELIESSGAGGASGAVFNVTNGTLTNAASGEIQSLAGTGSARILNAQLENQGTLTVHQSLTLSKASVAHSNSGIVDVQAGTLAFASSSTYTQTDGTTIVGAGTSLSATPTIQIEGGLLEGNGAVSGSVSNSGGTLSPGLSAPEPAIGQLTITGAYTQGPNGTLFIEIETANSFDRLVVNGTADLGGLLAVDLIDPFVPQAGQSYLVLNGATAGDFDSLDLPSLPAGSEWEVQTDPVTLNVVGTVLPNEPPVLDAIGNQTGNEGTAITFTAAASDPDEDNVTFSLDVGGPSGATIHATTGAFSWTPSEAQGPGTFSVTVRVTDDGDPALSDFETIMITVGEVNQPPVLESIADRNAGVGQTVSLTAMATDPDLPENELTFSLDAAPSGATINPVTGEFSWTPTAAHAGQTFGITVRVTDDGEPALDDTQTFNITVAAANQPPVLDPIGDQSGTEGTAITFTAAASDPDGGDLTFSLDAGAPSGATIDATTGDFTWTPGEAQGPGTFSVTVRVTDDGVPALSDFETITIAVGEVNQSPVLAAIDDRNAAVGQAVSLTAMATDADVPENELTFSLDAGSPSGATVNATTGEFSWTPAAGDAGQMFEITVRVTDNGDPTLSDTETFSVTVASMEANQPPVLDSIEDRNANIGQTVSFTATASDADGDDLTFSLDAAPSGATIDPVTGEFSWTPSPAQGGQTFEIVVRVTDDGDPALFDTESFSITVPPLVEPQFMVSGINGPNVGVPGQLRSYFVTFSDTGTGDSYTATIDWGDGTVDSGFVATSESGGNTTGVVSFWHTYTTIGDRTIELTLRDGQGNVQTAETDITVQLVTLQPDPLDPSRTALVAGGLDNMDDMISFNPQGGGINVMHRDYNHGQFSFDGSVIAFGQGGNDTITVNPSINRSAMLFGQAGNDQLFGGSGSNILVGGTGADLLIGSGVRDLLFGGLGADTLQGLGGDDLLASDFTVHEYDPALLAMLFHRWTSSDSYAERLHNLRFEEHPALNNTTVFNDFEVDQLTGGGGQDWFLFLASELVTGPEAGEEGLGVPFN